MYLLFIIIECHGVDELPNRVSRTVLGSGEQTVRESLAGSKFYQVGIVVQADDGSAIAMLNGFDNSGVDEWYTKIHEVEALLSDIPSGELSRHVAHHVFLLILREEVRQNVASGLLVVRTTIDVQILQEDWLLTEACELPLVRKDGSVHIGNACISCMSVSEG